MVSYAMLDRSLVPAAGREPSRRLRVIKAARSHLSAITAIYLDNLSSGIATFEDPAPDQRVMSTRLDAVLAAGLPALVAVDERGQVRGFAWARPFRERAAYRLTVENSIYVASDARRQGIGRLLMDSLIEACQAAGCRQMVAVIGNARNQASIALHKAAGFVPAGYFPGAGCRRLPDGSLEEVEMVMMQRSLVGGTVIGHA